MLTKFIYSLLCFFFSLIVPKIGQRYLKISVKFYIKNSLPLSFKWWLLINLKSASPTQGSIFIFRLNTYCWNYILIDVIKIGLKGWCHTEKPHFICNSVISSKLVSNEKLVILNQSISNHFINLLSVTRLFNPKEELKILVFLVMSSIIAVFSHPVHCSTLCSTPSEIFRCALKFLKILKFMLRKF